jgi:hypothetical protein
MRGANKPRGLIEKKMHIFPCELEIILYLWLGSFFRDTLFGVVCSLGKAYRA